MPEVRSSLQETAALYDDSAAELELAAEHCRIASQHFSDGEIPPGAAHAWAARGHMLNALGKLDEQAREHAQRSHPVT